MDWLVPRVLFALPVLFIGVLMIVDADGSLRSLGGLMTAMRSFEQRLRGMVWQQHMPVVVESSRGARTFIRCMGIAVVLAAVLPFVR